MEFSATVFHERVCFCEGIQFEEEGSMWDPGPTNVHYFLELGSIAMCQVPLSWQILVECEFCSPSLEYHCEECGGVTVDARRKWVMDQPPKWLATILNRRDVTVLPNGELTVS